MEPANLVEGTNVGEGTNAEEHTVVTAEVRDDEPTIDEEVANDEVSSAGAVARLHGWPRPIWRSIPRDPGAWHSGCRGPSPLVEAWVVRFRHGKGSH